MTPREFITALTPAAQNNAARSGVPASVTIAQAALESGWGESELAWRARNLFGIKADDAWTGNTIALPTREYIGGQWVNVTARFRSYPDWQGSIDDHAAFLRKNPRYSSAFSAPDSEQFAERIAAAGYATDPDYANKLVNIMRTYQLAALDESQPQLAAEPAAPPSKVEPAAAPYTPEDVFGGGEGGSSDPRRRAPVGDSGASVGNPAAPWPFPETTVDEQQATNVGSIIQSVATIAGTASPPLGALLQIAGTLFPRIRSIVDDKSQPVSQRNTAIGATVLDTIATATGATTRIEGLSRAASDPTAHAAATAALQPFYDMIEAGSGGISGARAQDLEFVRTNEPPWHSPSFVIACMLMPLLYVAMVTMAFKGAWLPDWTPEARISIISLIAGAIIGGLMGYYYGMITSRNRTAVG